MSYFGTILLQKVFCPGGTAESNLRSNLVLTFNYSPSLLRQNPSKYGSSTQAWLDAEAGYEGLLSEHHGVCGNWPVGRNCPFEKDHTMRAWVLRFPVTWLVENEVWQVLEVEFSI